VQPAAGRRHLGFAGDAVSDAVQEAGQRLRTAKRTGLADKHKESGLEGVFGVVFVAEQTTAHAPHQRRMAVQQRREGRFLAGGIAAQQIVVRRLKGARIVETIHASQQSAQCGTGHDGSPPWTRALSLQYSARPEEDSYRRFQENGARQRPDGLRRARRSSAFLASRVSRAPSAPSASLLRI
jgi:hypothetical protein